MFQKLVLALIPAVLAASPGVQLSERLVALEDPRSEGAVGAGLLLRRLDGVGRVLMIGAHPVFSGTPADGHGPWLWWWGSS